MNWQKTVLVSVVVVVFGALAFKGIIPKEYVLALLALLTPSPLTSHGAAQAAGGNIVNVIPQDAPTKPGLSCRSAGTGY